MPGPYGDGTNYYKIDADNLQIETISSRYLTRTDIHDNINSLTDQKTTQDAFYDNQIAQYNAMLTILDTP